MHQGQDSHIKGWRMVQDLRVAIVLTEPQTEKTWSAQMRMIMMRIHKHVWKDKIRNYKLSTHLTTTCCNSWWDFYSTPTDCMVQHKLVITHFPTCKEAHLYFSPGEDWWHFTVECHRICPSILRFEPCSMLVACNPYISFQEISWTIVELSNIMCMSMHNSCRTQNYLCLNFFQ